MHIQFAELPVSDQNRAIRFYTEFLGCEIAVDQPMAPDGWRWIELRFAGSETTLHFIRHNSDKPGDAPVLALVEKDVEGAVEALRSKGVKILVEPFRPPWRPDRLVAEFEDSEGNRMMIGGR
jgi:predicted enzyme related to lactoylglutathione lyase